VVFKNLENPIMQFIHQNLGLCEAGAVVQVTLSAKANVRLLDDNNFSNYRAGRRHNFVGGQALQSPLRLEIPASGHWHVVIDLGGHRGTVRAGVRVLNY
jgi:hypothetical protein